MLPHKCQCQSTVMSTIELNFVLYKIGRPILATELTLNQSDTSSITCWHDF